MCQAIQIKYYSSAEPVVFSFEDVNVSVAVTGEYAIKIYLQDYEVCQFALLFSTNHFYFENLLSIFSMHIVFII